MNKREFNKVLNSCSKKVKGQKRLDVEKVKALPDEVKCDMVSFLVRNRLPIVVEFLTNAHWRGPGDPCQWLSSCAYWHITKGKESGYTFLHTAEYAATYGIR